MPISTVRSSITIWCGCSIVLTCWHARLSAVCRTQTEEWVSEIGGQSWTAISWLRFAFLATTASLRQYRTVGPGPRGLPIGIGLMAGHAARRHFLLLPAPLKWLWAGQNHQSIRSQRSHSVAAGLIRGSKRALRQPAPPAPAAGLPVVPQLADGRVWPVQAPFRWHSRCRKVQSAICHRLTGKLSLQNHQPAPSSPRCTCSLHRRAAWFQAHLQSGRKHGVLLHVDDVSAAIRRAFLHTAFHG